MSLGFSSDLKWLRYLRGPELPIALRLGYRYGRQVGGDLRIYEFGGGLYYTKAKKWRLGADWIAALLNDIAPGLKARHFSLLLRAGYYWDANH